MRFGAPAAILLLSALLLVSTPTFADDNKSKDQDAATAAQSPNGPNAKKSAAVTDVNASAEAPTSPAPTTADATSNSPATEQHHKWVPMPALDGTPGLFTLGTGDTLPKGGFDVVAGVNKISRLPGDITVLQVVPSFGVGLTN